MVCCSSDRPPCGSAIRVGSIRRSLRSTDRSPVTWANATSNGGSTASRKTSRSSLSSAVITLAIDKLTTPS